MRSLRQHGRGTRPLRISGRPSFWCRPARRLRRPLGRARSRWQCLPSGARHGGARGDRTLSYCRVRRLRNAARRTRRLFRSRRHAGLSRRLRGGGLRGRHRRRRGHGHHGGRMPARVRAQCRLHHARRDAAAGNCLFNDCGVVIETLRAEYGLARIAYVDIDAHHGDGVFYAFEDDPGIFIADIHEDGRSLYPGTGAREETGTGAARGAKLNIPLWAGAADDAFFTAWGEAEEGLRRFRPEFIILQCGADSIAAAPLAHLLYTPAAPGHAAARLARGGGGYDRSKLARAGTAVVAAWRPVA